MAEETQPIKNKMLPVRYKSVRSPEYRVVPVNATLMHIATQDTIIVDLVLEHLPPSSETLSVFDRDNWLPEVPDPAADEIVALREVQIGLVMTPAAARWIALALTSKADETDRLRIAGTTPTQDAPVENNE